MKSKQLVIWLVSLLILFMVLISSCSKVGNDNNNQLQAEDVSPSSTQKPTYTLVPATYTPTNVAPSPTATHTPTITPTSTPAVISAINGKEIKLINKLGNGAMQNINLSSDGKLLLVLSSTALQVFDVDSNNVVWTRKLTTLYTQAMFSEQGNTILATTKGGGLQVLDALTGEMQETLLPSQPNIIMTKFTDNGRFLTIQDIDRRISVYDIAQKQFLIENKPKFTNMDVISEYLSPDGSLYLIFGNFMDIQVWSTQPVDILFTLASKKIAYRSFLNLKFSPSSKKVALVTNGVFRYDSSKIYVWGTGASRLVHEHQMNQTFSAVSFNSDETKIILGDENGSLKAFSLENMELIKEYPAQTNRISQIDVSPASNRMAYASQEGTIFVWDETENRQIAEVHIDLSIVVPPFLLKTDPVSYIQDEYYLFHSFAHSPDTNEMAITSPDLQSVQLVDLNTVNVIREFSDGGLFYSAIAMSNNEKIAAARDDYSIVIWDKITAKQQLVIPTGINEQIRELQFSPDGKWLSALFFIQSTYTGKFAQIQIWDAITGEKLQEHAGYLTFDFSPNGLFIASDNRDFGMYIWDLQTKKQSASVPVEFIFDLAYAPDGKSIAVAGVKIRKDIKANINLINFYDVENMYEKQPLELTGHMNRPIMMAYSPDGSLLASGDTAGNYYIWNVISGEMVQMIPELTHPLGIFFTPDQRSIIVVGGDGVIYQYAIR
ncbi:MAG: WD40 repeat domain-containing protein [Anaerolineaceae bacterium]|nr:WD40 repeat domain-containing protein [Anaerolineaceae bacterium]